MVVLLLMVVELLNTAIEKLSDRLTTDLDPQIRRVKDMGSAAVGVTLVIAGATWLFAIGEAHGYHLIYAHSEQLRMLRPAG